MIPLNKEEENFIKNKKYATYICKEKFCKNKDDEDYINRKKVKDHCHYTEKFREAAHSNCNLKVNLIVLGIIWKNISPFLFQLRKKL